MIKKCNKLFLIFVLFLFTILCFSCSNPTNKIEESKKIDIEFIVDETSYNVEIDSGSILTFDMIPVENINYILGLYYDESYEELYNNEKITKHAKIYVKYEDLTPYKEEVINLINTYCENLEYDHIKYSYMFIDDEVSRAIELLDCANNKEDIDLIKQNCITEINNLILTEDEYNDIIESYSLSKYYVVDPIYFPENEIILNFYLGKFDNKYIVHIKDQNIVFFVPGAEESFLLGSRFYIIKRYCYGWIGICLDDSFYELRDGEVGGKLGDNCLDAEQVDKIYERYLILMDLLE